MTQLVRIWPTEGAPFDKDVQDIRDFAWMNEIEEHRPLKPTAAGCGGCENRKALIRHVSEGDSDEMSKALEAGKKKGGAL